MEILKNLPPPPAARAREPGAKHPAPKPILVTPYSDDITPLGQFCLRCGNRTDADDHTCSPHERASHLLVLITRYIGLSLDVTQPRSLKALEYMRAQRARLHGAIDLISDDRLQSIVDDLHNALMSMLEPS